MTNPTRKEILEAYRELDMLLGHYDDRNPERVPECRAIIEKALPPRPQPTMAEVEWDDDLHYLAEAEVGEIKLLMLGPDLAGWIRGFNPETGKIMPAADPEATTPTGRRYTLTEVQDD